MISPVDRPPGKDEERAALIAALEGARARRERLETQLEWLIESRSASADGRISAPDTLGLARASSHERRRGGTAMIALFAGAGTLLVADAVATVTWQEPVTALLGHQRQNQLQDELASLEAARPSRSTSAPRLVGSGSPLGSLPRPKASRRPRPRPTVSPEQRVRTLADSRRAELRAGKAVGRLRIPRLGAAWAMIEGTGDSQLKSGPGHYPTSSLPGLPGTTAVAGHRTTYGAPFRHIDRLKAGDRITVEMPYGSVEYRVEGHRIVDPGNTDVLRDIGRPRLVLTACTPLYSAAQRWVVFARQVRVRPRTMS